MGTAAQTAHAAAIRAEFPGRFRLTTVTVVRKIKNTNSWSQHSYGNAIDSWATTALMGLMAWWTVNNATRFRISRVIFNRRIWKPDGRGWRTYTGVNPHTSHVHTDYLPQWVGTPPGRPAGTTGAPDRPYAVPGDRRAPYGRQWLRPVAFAMRGYGGLRQAPETASKAQVQSSVRGYRNRNGLGNSATMSKAAWDRVSSRGVARRARGRPTETIQRMMRFYRVHTTITIDGIFGPQTQQAVKRFQAQAQVRVTGAVGRNDWHALWWGPEAWKLTDPGDLEIIDWERPPDGSPTGEIAHSWDGVLRWVGGRQQRAGARAAGAARSMRGLIR